MGSSIVVTEIRVPAAQASLLADLLAAEERAKRDAMLVWTAVVRGLELADTAVLQAVKGDVIVVQLPDAAPMPLEHG